jgi:chorismate mutase
LPVGAPATPPEEQEEQQRPGPGTHIHSGKEAAEHPPGDPMTRLMEQSDLERANIALEEARERRDMAAIRLINKEIRTIRQRISDSRRKLAGLMTERIHLIEVVERARMQLLRYERHLEDHDRRIEQVRAQLRQMGGRIREEPGACIPQGDESPPSPSLETARQRDRNIVRQMMESDDHENETRH